MDFRGTTALALVLILLPSFFASLDAQDGGLDIEMSLKELESYLTTKEKDRDKPKFSESDKRKMEELAQIPKIKEVIRDLNEKLRRNHVEQAYKQNTEKGRDELYQHPVIQEYINKLGQSLVPPHSAHLYTFRVLYDPRPQAFALSTGSIYISTGMLSLIDNEAQLAFVLGHEIGHVELNHYYERIRGTILEYALAVEKQKSAAKKGAIFGAIAGAAGALAGGIAKGWGGAGWGALIAGGGTFGVVTLVESFKNKPQATSWSEVEEMEADEFGMEAAMGRNYDGREAPSLMLALLQAIQADPKVGMALHHKSVNIDERRNHLRSVLQNRLEGQIEAVERLSLGTTPNFHFLMAAVKRDNGIRALDYDLFRMATQNLEEAVAIRSTDPFVHHYLGKVYRLTGRDEESRSKAQYHFLQAIRFDAKRNVQPDPHLEMALCLIQEDDPKLYPQIRKELKTYVTLYNRVNRALPRSMSFIYDYLSLTGEEEWTPDFDLISRSAVNPSQDVKQ